MYHGLQVRMTADELKARISERIRVRSATADGLDERIKRREGDQPYDIRVEDGLESFGELVEARDFHRQRISELTLFRDRLAAELHSVLGERITGHEDSAAWWKLQASRSPEEQTEEEPVPPEQMCQNEADRHAWRAMVLRFIREHVDVTETYRLGPDDLAFGELLPAAPGPVEQIEYEERSRVIS